jgi:biotin synthase
MLLFGGGIWVWVSIEDRAGMLVALSTLNPQPICAYKRIRRKELWKKKPVEIWK